MPSWLQRLLRGAYPWAPFLCAPATIVLGSWSLRATVLSAAASVLLLLGTQRRRHGNGASLLHVVRVSSATYLVIAFLLVHDEFEVTPLEVLLHQYVFLLWAWLSLLPGLLRRGAISDSSSRLTARHPESSDCSCFLLPAVVTQIFLAVSVSFLLLTSACTPMMLFDWLLLPADCSQVFQNKWPARQYVTAVLCMLWAAMLLSCSVCNLGAARSSLASQSLASTAEDMRRVVRYFKTSGNPWRHRMLVLSVLWPVLYYCVFHLPIGCRAVVRRVVPPEELLRNVSGAPGSLPLCQPPLGSLEVPLRVAESWEEVENRTRGERGGAWRPGHCRPWQRVAIIVPYRDRERQLLQLLATLHPFLRRQQASYRIFVVEQAGKGVFNRGKVKDAGFLEAERRGPFDCYVFHDVDMLPERQDNLYLCDSQPRHLCPALDEMRYTLPFNNLLGGVVAMTGGQFRKANGYSTIYWGWGAEDDDLSARVEEVGMIKTQPPNHIGRYKMLRHVKDVHNSLGTPLLWTWRSRWREDGISNPEMVQYKVISETERPLFTHILVDVGFPPSSFAHWLQGTAVTSLWCTFCQLQEMNGCCVNGHESCKDPVNLQQKMTHK